MTRQHANRPSLAGAKGKGFDMTSEKAPLAQPLRPPSKSSAGTSFLDAVSGQQAFADALAGFDTGNPILTTVTFDQCILWLSSLTVHFFNVAVRHASCGADSTPDALTKCRQELDNMVRMPFEFVILRAVQRAPASVAPLVAVRVEALRTHLRRYVQVLPTIRFLKAPGGGGITLVYQPGTQEVMDAMYDAQSRFYMFLAPFSSGNFMGAPTPPPKPTNAMEISPDFTSWRVGINQYTFTKSQAACMRAISELSRRGALAIRQESVFAFIRENEIASIKHKRLDHVFRTGRQNGKVKYHSAWGSLIRPVAGARGTYQLVLET